MLHWRLELCRRAQRLEGHGPRRRRKVRTTITSDLTCRNSARFGKVVGAFSRIGAASARSRPGPGPAGGLTVEGVRIAHNSMTKNGVGTQATLSLTQTAGTIWKFDFCELLREARANG